MVELWQEKRKLGDFVPTEPGGGSGGHRRNRGRSGSSLDRAPSDQIPSQYFADWATVATMKKKKLLREKKERLEKSSATAVAAGRGRDKRG